jgi:hypothetical protein
VSQRRGRQIDGQASGLRPARRQRAATRAAPASHVDDQAWGETNQVETREHAALDLAGNEVALRALARLPVGLPADRLRI